MDRGIIEFFSGEKAGLKALVELSNVNANGYDMEYNGSKSFVCEVKGTIPAGGKNRFGEAQVREIEKDIEGLLGGKTKLHLSSEELEGDYKFLCFYYHNRNSVEATEYLVNRINGERDGQPLVSWKENEELRLDKVYVFLVNLDGVAKEEYRWDTQIVYWHHDQSSSMVVLR